MAYYNTQRFHSALGCVALKDFLAGKAEESYQARDAKLEKAR